MGVGFGIIFVLLVVVIALSAGALLGALFLQIATKWAMKFKIPYGKAFKTVLIGTFASIALTMVMALGYYGGAYSQGGMEQVQALTKDSSTGLLFNLASAIMSFFLGATIYGQMIKYPDTDTPIGFKKGIRISLFQMLLGFLIALPLILVFALVIGGMLAH